MILRFPGIGMFGLTDGGWHEVISDQWSADRPVMVVVRDRDEFDAFRPSGEVDREWLSDGGIVRVSVQSFEEIVQVGRRGRYRGEPVDQMGRVRDGMVYVGLLWPDPGVASRLGFGGDGRIDPFNKRIALAEFTDVVEEVTVRYRRGEGFVDE